MTTRARVARILQEKGPRSYGEADIWPEKESLPYLHVAVGTVVHTRDNHKIGVVSEVRGEHFRIKMPWWQHDYWLRSDSIHSAAPGEAAVLNVDKARLDEVKIVDVPPVD